MLIANENAEKIRLSGDYFEWYVGGESCRYKFEFPENSSDGDTIRINVNMVNVETFAVEA